MHPKQTSPRRFSKLCSVLALVTLSLAVPAASQTPDDFNPNANNWAYALAVQPDGEVLVGGPFTTLAGQTRSRLGRLHADGTLDLAFNPGAASSVLCIFVQPDGKILVGGQFSGSTGLGGITCNRIGRLESDGTRDPNFNSSADNTVSALVAQADGKVLVGGYFTTLAGQSRRGLGRLNVDGTLDTSFTAVANGNVFSLALQEDGRILVGGSFATLSGTNRNRIGRLSSDGTLDTAFNPGANGSVYALARQTDGRVLVGGAFSTLGEQTRTNIGRLNSDGTLDNTFNLGANGEVHSLAVQADGKILVAGSFTRLGEQACNSLGRLNADGTLDNSFNPSANGTVHAVLVQGDGAVLAAGRFTTLGGTNRNYIGRLNNSEPATQDLAFDGSSVTWLRGGTSPEVWRTSFDVSTNGTDWTSLGAGERVSGGWRLAGVSAPTNSTLRARGFVGGGYYNGSSWSVQTGMGPPVIGRQPGSQLLRDGESIEIGVTAMGTAPLSYQWRKDGVYLDGATAASLALTNVQAGAAGGYDVLITNTFGSVTSVVAKLVLATDGFNPGASGGWGSLPGVYALAVQADEKVLVAGNFTTLGGQTRNYIGRLNADGTLDTAFNPVGDSWTFAVAAQPDGKILVGGWFGSLGGQVRNYLGRLNADGSVEPDFDPAPRGGGSYGGVYALALQPDGNIIVGGGISTLAGPACTNIGRLNPNGSRDATFTAWADEVVYCVALQSDGRMVIGGNFTNVCGRARSHIARLNPDGSLDPDFNPGVNDIPLSLVVQPDGKILAGGSFTSLGGQTRNRIGRLNADGSLDASFNPGAGSIVRCLALQADGKILVGGEFTTLSTKLRSRIGRLNPDGTVDQTFDPGAGNTVYGLTVQPDGKILAGGSFSTLGGQARLEIGRLNNTDPAVQSVTLEGDRLSWMRSGSSPEVWRVDFDASINGVDWFSLGVGARVADGWQATNVVVPAGATVRARGAVASGRYNASLWFAEASIGSPAISLQPASRTNLAGTLASFSVLAAGTPPLGYQWRKGGVTLNEGGNVFGTYTQSLLLSNVSGADAGGYSVVVSNVFGSVTSQVAILSVPDPFITAQPLSRTNDAGSTAVFDVTTVGTAPLSYQWRKNGAALAAATAASLALTNVQYTDAGGYDVVVSNVFGSVTSLVVSLTILDPFIVSPPASQSAFAGDTVVFSVTAGGAPPLGYQWRKDGTQLAGATASLLTLTNVQAANAGGFDVVVSNGLGCVTSLVATLTVCLAAADAFTPEATNGDVWALAVQPDGKVLLGGDFTTLGGQTRNYIGRLNGDGTLDAGFNPGTSGRVLCLALQADSKIVVGGNFAGLGGQPRYYIGRLTPDGTVDTAFNPGANNWVYSLAVQADGRILVGGGFTTLGGQTRNYLGRLNSDGSLDTGFNPGAGLSVGYPFVSALAVQSDGKILVGGRFTTLAGQARNRIGRLNSDGTLDASFNPGAGEVVNSLVLQADASILVGGVFTTLGGQTRNRIGRLNSDGTLDPAFDPGASGDVYSLGVQADGKVLVGGVFTTLCGQPRNRLGRLNSDGSLDLTFYPGASSAVYALAMQADGKIVLGGSFTNVAGQPRSRIARLNSTDPATQSLSFDGTNINWLRDGTSPEVWRTSFDSSTNSTDWVSLRAGERIAGGWRLTGVSVPAAASIRARGFATGGNYNGSSWFVESTLQLRPELFGTGVYSNGFEASIRAVPGQVVVIEASTNLVQWVAIQTNVVPSGGVIFFTDPESGGLPRRFYRARYHEGPLPPPAIGAAGGDFGFQTNQFGFSLTGVPGQTVVIQASTNLAAWTPLATNTLDGHALYFSDPASKNYAQRFYRAAVVP